MRVLLRENVEKLGRRGEIVDVKEGYARNYLIPHGLAWLESEENMRRLEAEKRQYIQRMAQLKEEREELAQRLGKLKLTIQVQANEEGHLYGAVREKQVLDAYVEEGIELDGEDVILLDEPIRQIGIHKYFVKVHPELDEVECTIWVVPMAGVQQ